MKITRALDLTTIILALALAWVLGGKAITRIKQNRIDRQSVQLEQVTLLPPVLSPNGKELTKSVLYDLAEEGVSVGDRDAAVTLFMLWDYSCGWCRLQDSILRLLRARYPQHLRVVYSELVHEQQGPVYETHLGARCADDQDNFAAYNRAAFSNFSLVIQRYGWRKLAQIAGVHDIARFEECVRREVHGKDVVGASEMGRSLGFSGTPSIIVGDWAAGGCFHCLSLTRWSPRKSGEW